MQYCEAGRTAIESTSVLLKKLEAPDLEMEDAKDEELRLEDADPGGGYDPYNQKTPVRKSSQPSTQAGSKPLQPKPKPAR